jgi:hypothetical protein
MRSCRKRLRRFVKLIWSPPRQLLWNPHVAPQSL